MKHYDSLRRLIIPASAVLLFGSMLLTGCKKDDDNPSSASNTMETSATDDAVLSISGAMGDDNGGASNTVGDMIALASPDGVAGLASKLAKADGSEGTMTVDTTYDPTSGWWSMTVTKERGSSSGLYYAKFARSYRYQFLKNNVPQRYWRVAGASGTDTATVIKFVIVSGTGEFHTPHIHQVLKSLTGSFTSVNTNTDTITVNSDAPYVRSGVDTLTLANSMRTLDHAVTMTFTGIKGPRLRPNSTILTRRTLTTHTTGTVAGTYTAKVTVQRGESYNEKTIDRQFTITLSGGRGSIGVNGEGRRFTCDLSNGDAQF